MKIGVMILSAIVFILQSAQGFSTEDTKQSGALNQDNSEAVEFKQLKNNIGKAPDLEWRQSFNDAAVKVNELQKSKQNPEMYEANKNALELLQQKVDIDRPKPDGVHVRPMPFSPGEHIEEEYKNGKRNGYWKQYDKDGSLISEGQNKEGHETPETTKYYPSGVVSMRQFVETGETTSKYQRQDIVKEIYRPDGSLRRVEIIRNGGQVNLTNEYYESGKLELERVMKASEKKPTTVEIKETAFDENGELFTGTKKMYGEGGELIREAEYQNGAMQGVVKHYNKEGKVVLVATYQDGQLVAQGKPDLETS